MRDASGSGALCIALALCAAGAVAAAPPNYRGFGRVEVARETLRPLARAGEIAALRFSCETPEKAETVAGKFLMDLYSEDGVIFTNGIHETPGGAAFAVERDGRRTAIYAADSREALESVLPPPVQPGGLVASASVPEYMRAFGWGAYGIGGLEGFHDWMAKARGKADAGPKADGGPLDPRDDFAFLKEMGGRPSPAETGTRSAAGSGGMHFDNWLEFAAMDNSDGIVAPGVYSRERLARDAGVPFGMRVYIPDGKFDWSARRFAARAERPADWMQDGWHHYDWHQPHFSWFDKDVWGYFGSRVRDAMARFSAGGAVRSWMHPVGELVHDVWYDLHADYSPTASASWRAFLSGRMTLDEAAAAYNRAGRPFASWDEVPVPEFATFAGISGMVLDLRGAWQVFTNAFQAAGSGESTPEGRFNGGPGADFILEDFPGNWDMPALYTEPGRKPPRWIGDGRRPEQRGLRRRFRRVFTWGEDTHLAADRNGAATGRDRVWLYFFPMSGATLRHEISLNGGASRVAGNWCALDVTDDLRTGENTLDIILQGAVWRGRVFLSSERPEMYPNMAEPRCRLWTLWHDWRRDAKAARCEEIFDAMRQADPNAPIEFMAPLRLGQRLTDRLMRDWGGFAHFTGEGSWFFPWYKRYGKLYGYQGTSELAGPGADTAAARRSALRVFLAGLDMHKPVFLTQTYSRNPELREWWLGHRGLLSRMGTYDIDLSQPQVLIYRRTQLTDDCSSFPEPFPLIDEAIGRTRSPWDYDIGRGSLQSIGQSFLYIDDNGIEDAKMDGFKVMIDCGNEIVPEDEVARIKAWVEKGGVFVAYPFTGRSTPFKADSWPMAALTGAKIKVDEKIAMPGKVPKVAFPGGPQSFAVESDALKRVPPVVFPSFAGQTIRGAKHRVHQNDFALETVSDDAIPILFWEDGRVAATARRVGKGLAVHLGSLFWRGSEDVLGIWKPQDEFERAFLRDLLAAAGHPPALVETDDRLVLAQPYRSNNGLDLVAVLCNFNEENDDGFHVEAQRGGERRETVVRLRCGRKPRRIVGHAGEGVLFTNRNCHNCSQIANTNVAVATGSLGVSENAIPAQSLQNSRTPDSESNDNSVNPVNPVKNIPFDWDEAAGVATLRIALPPQEVAVLEAECHAPADALSHWWAESQEQWHEIRKPTRDFSKYYDGEWRDPTQDLKEGWTLFTNRNRHNCPQIANTNVAVATGSLGVSENAISAQYLQDSKTPRSESNDNPVNPVKNIPLDCLQFWGWPEGRGAICRKTFDLAAPAWAAAGEPGCGVPASTRLVVGAWVGPNFLSPATIRLNGSNLVERTMGKYLDFDVAALLRPTGNVLEIEFSDAPTGTKFTGMNGSIYLYRREAPEMSFAVRPDGGGNRASFGLFAPHEWRGRYRVRLYMDGPRGVPKGVRVRDRFARRHHHNFGNITDIDITDLLRFGETNCVDLGANSPAEQPDKTSAETLTTLRIDLYPERQPK